MEDLNHRPDAALLLEDVIEPVLPFLPPGDIRSLRAASHRVKEAIRDRSPAMLILGERRLPTMMGVRHFWDDAENEEGDLGEWVRVYQIQKFHFALSVKSDLVDEECKLTSSIIVVEVVLHNGVWEEANRLARRPLPSRSFTKTVVAIDIKSIIPKRAGDEEDEVEEYEYFRHIFQGGRRHCSTRFLNKLFVTHTSSSSPNDLPRCLYCNWCRFLFPDGGSAGLARFEPQLRLTMAIFHECFKRIESFPDETSYPSAGFLMRQLPKPLHRYFPNEFDRERPCRDRNLIVVEFEYRRSRGVWEWQQEWRDRFLSDRSMLWMEEYDLNGPRSLPWYRDDRPRFLEDDEDYRPRFLEDDEDYDDDEDDYYGKDADLLYEQY
jgi:hypothetical protein